MVYWLQGHGEARPDLEEGGVREVGNIPSWQKVPLKAALRLTEITALKWVPKNSYIRRRSPGVGCEVRGLDVPPFHGQGIDAREPQFVDHIAGLLQAICAANAG